MASCWHQNQGTRTSDPRRWKRGAPPPFSFIRTLTVGLGIAPNLLTLPSQSLETEGARGLGLLSFRRRSSYRRWGISPRPENTWICAQSDSQNRYPLFRNTPSSPPSPAVND